MCKINYSIIIPHRNSAEMLQYCLDSIPARNDIQVIVVDDNSDSNKVDFDKFPKWSGKNYEYYLTKKGKGAGYARNVGLDYAVGTWVIFIDADDYFLPCVDDLLTSSKENPADVVFFRPKSVMLHNHDIVSYRDVFYNNIIDEYFATGNEDKIRVQFHSPCCKLIKLSLIKDYKISFDEIRYSNDCFFAVSVGCYANKIAVLDKTYYVITESQNSLTSKFLTKKGELECRTKAFLKSVILAHRYKYVYDKDAFYNYLYRLFPNNPILFYSYVAFALKENTNCMSILKRGFNRDKKGRMIIKITIAYIFIKVGKIIEKFSLLHN